LNFIVCTLVATLQHFEKKCPPPPPPLPWRFYIFD